mgnify:CR=1 FL=1
MGFRDEKVIVVVSGYDVDADAFASEGRGYGRAQADGIEARIDLEGYPSVCGFVFKAEPVGPFFFQYERDAFILFYYCPWIEDCRISSAGEGGKRAEYETGFRG